MKIVYLVGSFPKLSETFILNQITHLIDRGYDVEIVAYHNPHEENVHEDVIKYGLLKKTHFLQYKDDQSLLLTSNVRQLISCFDADLVHVHFAARPADVAFDILEKIGIPYIITAHAYDIFLNPDNDRLRIKFEKSEKVITVSQYNYNYLCNTFGDSVKDKIVINNYGIDVKRFKYIERPAKKTVRILYVGRLVEKKRILDCIESVNIALKTIPDIELRIIGDGPLTEEAKRKIASLNLTEKVFMLGSLTQEKIIEEMEQADIYLLPSAIAKDGDREGMPLVIMEAQAMGLPVVSTRHTGIPEEVIDGKTALLAEEGDCVGMAESILRLAENHELRLSMGLAGRQLVEGRFNIDHEIDRLEKIIEEVASTYKQRNPMRDMSQGRYEKRVSSYYARVMEHLEEKIRQQEQHFVKQLKQQEQQLKQLQGFINDMQRTFVYRVFRKLKRYKETIFCNMTAIFKISGLVLSGFTGTRDAKQDIQKITYLPDWSHSNPYQKLLYLNMEKKGYFCHPLKKLTLRWVAENLSVPHIIHIHWEEGLYLYLSKSSLYSQIYYAVILLGELFLLKQFNFNIIYTVHNYQPHESKTPWIERKVRQMIIKWSDTVIVHSQTGMDYLEREFCEIKHKIAILPHGSYAGYYPNSISRDDARKKLCLTDKKIVFLFLGTVRPYKGVSSLISAFQETDLAGVTLVIAGQSHDLQFQRQLEDMASGDERIKLCFRYIPDEELQIFFNAADIVVFPYKNILTSGSLMLAISFGKYTVAPMSGNIPEIISDDIGYLYDPAEGITPAVLTKAIDRYSKIQPFDKIKKLADNLRWENIIDQYVKVYQRLS